MSESELELELDLKLKPLARRVMARPALSRERPAPGQFQFASVRAKKRSQLEKEQHCQQFRRPVLFGVKGLESMPADPAAHLKVKRRNFPRQKLNLNLRLACPNPGEGGIAARRFEKPKRASRRVLDCYFESRRR